MSSCSYCLVRKRMNCLSLEGTWSEFWREEKMAGGRWRGTGWLDWCLETIWENSEHTRNQEKYNRIHTDKRLHTPQPHTEAHACASAQNRSVYASCAKHIHTHIFVRLYMSPEPELNILHALEADNDLIIYRRYKTCSSDTLLQFLLTQQSFPARFLNQPVRLLFINDLPVLKRYCIVTLLPHVLYSWDYTNACSTVSWDWTINHLVLQLW